jgi:predicted P-loop ATPase
VWTGNLHPRHHHEIVNLSGVSEDIAKLNFWTVEDPCEADKLLCRNTKSRWHHSGHLVPAWAVQGVDPKTGETFGKGAQLKPDIPIEIDGKPQKYIGISGEPSEPLFLDTGDSNYWAKVLSDRTAPIFIVEGAKKAASLLSLERAAISIPGVWNAQLKGVLKESIEQFCGQDRKVYLIFDSDLLTNPKVRQALERLAELLIAEGCDVFVVLWDAQYKGVDDLAVGAGAEAVRQAIASAITAQEWRDLFRSEKPETPQPRGFRRDYETIAAALGDSLRWNTLLNRPEIDGNLFPVDLVRSGLIVDRSLNVSGGKDALVEIVISLAKKSPYDPVGDYLRACEKEYGAETAILDKFASKVFGNEDAIAQIQVRKTLISAVARAVNPGCQLRTALVLVGPQNWGKSKFWKTLASPDWFCDDFYDPSDKDHLLKLHESWIVEWAELHGLNKREATRVKQFMTTATDRVRRPYGREAEPLKRPSIMVGTSNDDAFLTDCTGNTRWWVIKIHKEIDIDWVSQNRDQIWGAAVALYLKGEQFWLTPEEEAQAEAVRTEYQYYDPWHERIENFVADKSIVALWEVWKQLEIEPLNQDVAKQTRIVNTLKRLGWERAPNAIQNQGKRSKVWKKNLPSENRGAGVPRVPDALSKGVPPDTPSNTPRGVLGSKEGITNADDF